MTPPALGPRTKGLRLAAPVEGGTLAAGRPEVTGPQFSWPLLTLDDAAIEHNLALMARLCEEAGVEHAPHVKTAMSPQLFARQQAHGAWGATVANPAQLRTVRDWGTTHVFLANELVDPREVAWVREELTRAAEAEIWLYVDSTTGLDLLVRGFAEAPDAVRARLGVQIGRASCRERVF